MPLQILDFILIGTMLVSGLLALSRGFTREALSLLAWGAAALAAAGAILSPSLMGLAKNWLQPEIVATVGVGAGVFIIVLIIASLIGVKIADWVLDSAAGVVDRSLGFAYGLARGLLLVTVAYLFYIWLVPADKREAWIKNALSRPMIESTAVTMLSFMPADLDQMLRSKMSTAAPADGEATPPEGGYQSGQTRGMNQLIQGTGSGATAQPPAGPADPAHQPVFGSESSEGQ